MHSKHQFQILLSHIISRVLNPMVTVVIALLIASVLIQVAQAQTLHVLHRFTAYPDGEDPVSGLTMDSAGNLYGTNDNTVYQMTRRGSEWDFATLYNFEGRGYSYGYIPAAKVIFGPDGNLYGTTSLGGIQVGDGLGTVFNLTLSGTETVIYGFLGPTGAIPLAEVVFDPAGNLYGTTAYGGRLPAVEGSSYGVVYKLTPSNNGWRESVVHAFTGGRDGGYVVGGLLLDSSGNLYGTTQNGGDLACPQGYGVGCGVVFQMVPSGSGWTENVLHVFEGQSDGARPITGLVSDVFGNLYGTTGGGVFELTPTSNGWRFTTLHSGVAPSATLAIDPAGNLYGTACGGGDGWGNIFELSPVVGGWTYASLYDFTGGSDGSCPRSQPVLDASGNLYGTTEFGGTGCWGNGCGTVWELTR